MLWECEENEENICWTLLLDYIIYDVGQDSKISWPSDIYAVSSMLTKICTEIVNRFDFWNWNFKIRNSEDLHISEGCHTLGSWLTWKIGAIQRLDWPNVCLKLIWLWYLRFLYSFVFLAEITSIYKKYQVRSKVKSEKNGIYQLKIRLKLK